jgi:hypothetical protein
MYADEVLCTGRVGGVVMVFLCFGWCEGEPTHFCFLAAAARRDRDQSRISWVMGGASSAVRDGGSPRERSSGRKKMVVLGDMDVEMDCESKVRNGAFESNACANRGMVDT